ncbi:hypothetical protein J4220_01570 [Candidatus Micrarchaeota archaeon]|nr:hypothetical protein [Candidatus Micrarchaeota archaeon]
MDVAKVLLAAFFSIFVFSSFGFAYASNASLSNVAIGLSNSTDPGTHRNARSNRNTYTRAYVYYTCTHAPAFLSRLHYLDNRNFDPGGNRRAGLLDCNPPEARTVK